jgi:wyosine [tRNA(Phe)-imidazoG37] synthetase (radical SAM superfamily)
MPTRVASKGSDRPLTASGRPRPLPLETTIVYGPIASRRLGRSLGVNLLPKRYKICSFDCIYCHYGTTDVKAVEPEVVAVREADFPTLGEVVRAVEAALRSRGALDSITFSGNGEPTLHPYFPEIVFEVSRLRDRYCPGAKVALFSNATTLARPEIRACLQRIDAPILKLDAGDAATFARINRPVQGIDFAGVVEALGQIPDLILQTVLIDGPVTNAGGEPYEAWLRTLGELKPAQVQLYSTDYPVPIAEVQRVPAFRLRQLAETVERRTGVPVQAY